MMIPTLSFVNSMYEITFIYSPQTLEHDISLNKNDSTHYFSNKNPLLLRNNRVFHLSLHKNSS